MLISSRSRSRLVQGAELQRGDDTDAFAGGGSHGFIDAEHAVVIGQCQNLDAQLGRNVDQFGGRIGPVGAGAVQLKVDRVSLNHFPFSTESSRTRCRPHSASAPRRDRPTP